MQTTPDPRLPLLVSMDLPDAYLDSVRRSRFYIEVANSQQLHS
jgi:hypothetical protein